MIATYKQYYKVAKKQKYLKYSKKNQDDQITNRFASVEDYRDQWKPKLEFEIYETLLCVKYQSKMETKVTQKTANKLCEAYIIRENQEEERPDAIRAYFNPNP